MWNLVQIIINMSQAADSKYCRSSLNCYITVSTNEDDIYSSSMVVDRTGLSDDHLDDDTFDASINIGIGKIFTLKKKKILIFVYLFDHFCDLRIILKFRKKFKKKDKQYYEITYFNIYKNRLFIAA